MEHFLDRREAEALPTWVVVRDLDAEALHGRMEAGWTDITLRNADDLALRFIQHGVSRRVLAESLDGLMDAARAGAALYTDVGDVLWQMGHPALALQWEHLLNHLPISKQLCRYSAEHFTDAGTWSWMCAQHTHIDVVGRPEAEDLSRSHTGELAPMPRLRYR